MGRAHAARARGGGAAPAQFRVTRRTITHGRLFGVSHCIYYVRWNGRASFSLRIDLQGIRGSARFAEVRTRWAAPAHLLDVRCDVRDLHPRESIS